MPPRPRRRRNLIASRAVAAEFVKRAVTKRTGHKRISDSWAAERDRLLRVVEVLPKIGSKRIGDVTKADILRLLEGMVDRGSAVNANRLLAVLRRMFNWCLSRGARREESLRKANAAGPPKQVGTACCRKTKSALRGPRSTGLVGRSGGSRNFCS